MEEEHCIGDSIYYSRSNSLQVQACASDCRARFWTSLASNGEDYDELCRAFSKLAQNEGHGLPMLYCCDSQLCEMGVMADADINLGISRVLSSCQSEGYDASTNPADPDQAHVLSKSKRGREDARRENTAPAGASTTATPSGFLVEGFHTITTKTSPPPANEILPCLTASDSHVLHAVTTKTSTPLRERAQDTSKVPSGTKVTIGVSVMVGILAVVALIAWHMRIRIRLRNKKRISRPVKPSSLPPTPLISPSSSYAGPPTNGPLTPPARLQERRFLLTRALSLRRSNYRRRRDDEEEPEEWSAVPLAPMPPLTPPSASRPAKRPLEQDEPSGITATTTISMTTTAPPRPPRNDIPPAGSLSSVFSRASTLRAVASNASSDSAQFGPSSVVTAMELPRQPARVYETPPVIRGLASPGPPPNRALPSLPADGRRSPLRSPLASPKSPTRRASPSSGAAPAPQPSLGATEGNRCPRKSREESGGNGRTARESGLQSTRRAKHARSPLLNEVCLNSATKTE
ncbi:hypothetical protein M419DRAFT_79182 [Trichoderma reesei RUT C-30]|uniref:Uncharacterized protein n=1 Tax=Hypocrea jecorina (strain ATCC 56765 / BCRC 32924 / NRRL 11460 / Rut C-30) TaxID=1344414 RepID=A0A024S9R6_HYPJR|nr:hypothetical protein M419DRAFT_79182 [Trichoderma reesei RUT C-30]